MGLPVVGKRHRRNAYPQKAANRDLGTVPDRICSAGGIGHSSTHNQRSIAAAKSASKRQRPLGALLLRRIAAERNHDAGHVHGVRQDVDSSALGQHAPGASQDRGSRTMAADGRQSERNQGQNQNRHVGHFFACGSLGVLPLQFDFIGNPGGNGRKAGAERRGACQRQAATRSAGVVTRGSQTWPDRDAVPRPAPGVPDRSIGNSSRRDGSASLDGLQLLEGCLSYPPLVLLAAGRASERHEDGRLGEASAHAAGIEECTARVENAELLSAECGFRVSVTSSEGTKAARSRGGTQPQDQASIRQVWHPRSGLAYLSAHGRKHAGRDGRTPTHHPRLSAPQQSERDQQIFAGHVGDQAVGAGQTGRRNLAYRVVVAEQNHTHSIILPRATRAIESVAVQAFPDVNLELGRSVGPRLGPRFLDGFSIWLKNMVGTTGLEPATSTVSR